METLHSMDTAIKPVKSSLKHMLYEKGKHFKKQNALNMFTKTMIDSNDDNVFYIYFSGIENDVLNRSNYQME